MKKTKVQRKKSQNVIDLTETCPYCLGHKVQKVGHWETECDEQYFVFDNWQCKSCGEEWKPCPECSIDSVCEAPCPNCGAHWGRAWWTDPQLHPEEYNDDSDPGPENFVAQHCNDCGHTWLY